MSVDFVKIEFFCKIALFLIYSCARTGACDTI